MSEAKRNFWVGVFVIASLVMFAVLMAWFGETPDWLGGNEWTLDIVDVPDLRGIDAGSPVYLNGVQIGRVRMVDFVDSHRPDIGVKIIARIKDPYTIPRDSVARVYGATLGFGTGHIDIVTEPSTRYVPLAKETAQIRGEMRSIVGEIISKDLVNSVERTITNFGDLAEAATPVARNLSHLLESRTVAEVAEPGAAERGVTPNLSTVVERFDRFIGHLNEVLGDVNIQSDVRSAIQELRTAAMNIRQTSEIWQSESQRVGVNLNAGILRIADNLDHSFGKLNSVLDELDTGAESLSKILGEVAAGKGTVGLMVRDERLYESAVLSLDRLSDALARLQAILSKIEMEGYINLGLAPSGILRQKMPLKEQDEPAGEPASRR